jgi:two-component system, NarL family, nitrate/nitrite response regulator NarL
MSATQRSLSPIQERSSAMRVAIAAGHPVIRGVAKLSCESVGGIEVLAEASTVDEVVELCRRLPIDLLILDVDLRDGDGLDALRTVRPEGFVAPVLVLTDRTDGSAVLDALRLGVRGYLGKADGLRTVGASARRIVAGERLMAPALEQVAVRALGRFAKQAREGSEVRAILTLRERQILAMVSEGLSVRQMARELSISPRTVESHTAKLYRKLGVRTRIQAVARAAAVGLVDLE